MTAPTNIRSGRASALLVAVQSAKQVPVSDFATGSAGFVMSEEYQSDIRRRKSSAEGWMTSSLMHEVGRHSIPSAREGFLRVKATPTVLEWLLRANWGSYSAGAFSLASGIPAWLTLAFLEDDSPNPSGLLHRIYDAWPHIVSLTAALGEPMVAEVFYAGERELDPDTVSAVVTPSRPFFPSDQALFPGRTVQVFRDPDGDNEEIPFEAVSLTFDQGLGLEWDMMAGRDAVFKRGHPGPRVTLELVAHVSRETWRPIEDSRADLKATYRFLATADDGTEFQVDLHNLDWEIEPIGHQGLNALRFRAVGTAHYDDTDFVDITLS